MVTILLYLFFCVGHLVATRNWCSLNASLKRSHAIPDGFCYGLNLFRARKSAYMLSGMMLSYPALVFYELRNICLAFFGHTRLFWLCLALSVIPGLTGYLVLYVMYRWSMLLGNGSYDLFPGSLNIAMK